MNLSNASIFPGFHKIFTKKVKKIIYTQRFLPYSFTSSIQILTYSIFGPKRHSFSFSETSLYLIVKSKVITGLSSNPFTGTLTKMLY